MCTSGHQIGKEEGRKKGQTKKSGVWAIPELSASVVFGNAELGHPKLLGIKKLLLISSRGVTICPWICSHVPCPFAVLRFLKS